MGCSYLSDWCSVCGERPLAIAAMNVELPPFKNGEHNSESVSTLDRFITPLKGYKTINPFWGACLVLSNRKKTGESENKRTLPIASLYKFSLPGCIFKFQSFPESKFTSYKNFGGSRSVHDSFWPTSESESLTVRVAAWATILSSFLCFSSSSSRWPFASSSFSWISSSLFLSLTSATHGVFCHCSIRRGRISANRLQCQRITSWPISASYKVITQLDYRQFCIYMRYWPRHKGWTS